MAAASITDGEKDNGIDAFYFHEATHVLWLVQSKFIQDGSGQPDLKDVALFPVGVRMLLAGELDRFNKFFTDRRAELDKALSDPHLRVKLVLVDTGTDFADDRVTLFEDLKLELNKVDGAEYLTFDHFNLPLVHEEITETFARKPINETLTLRQPEHPEGTGLKLALKSFVDRNGILSIRSGDATAHVGRDNDGRHIVMGFAPRLSGTCVTASCLARGVPSERPLPKLRV